MLLIAANAGQISLTQAVHESRRQPVCIPAMYNHGFFPSLLVITYLAYSIPIFWSPEICYNEVLQYLLKVLFNYLLNVLHVMA